MLANDTAGSIKAAAQLYTRAQRPNLFIKIPGTREGIPAIEETIFAGVPVNVTLLFSRKQYIAATGAYMRGIERRIVASLDPKVDSVASIFVSRWDVAVKNKVPDKFRNRLGIAIAKRTYKAYRDLLASPRWQKTCRLRRSATAPPLGQHRYERPRSLGHPLLRSARSTGHHQHHTRENIACLRRAR